MTRQMLEEYLDGGLSPEERAQIDRALAHDGALRSQLTRLDAERKLRAAVYASYEPSAAEARAMAREMLAACREESAGPVARIGMASPWWRVGAVAAAIAVVAGSFWAGRLTSPIATVHTEKIVEVVYSDINGDVQTISFNSAQEASNFIRDYQSRDAVAWNDDANANFDPEHSGEF